jgi:integrase
VVEDFDKAGKPKIKLARLLALYTGQRRSDVVAMNWARFDGEMIEVRKIKTGGRIRERLGYVVPDRLGISRCKIAKQPAPYLVLR